MEYTDFFTYDSDLGVLIWKDRPRVHFETAIGAGIFKARYACKVAGVKNGAGYVVIGVSELGKRAKMKQAHRIIWEMHYGAIPRGMHIDHINGIKSDNRLQNLRVCTMSQNACNAGAHKDSVSGIRGVSPSGYGTWIAAIHLNGKQTKLGTFPTKEQAALAYSAAAKSMHGEFTRS